MNMWELCKRIRNAFTDYLWNRYAELWYIWSLTGTPIFVFGMCELVMGIVVMIVETSNIDLDISCAAGWFTIMAAYWTVRRRIKRGNEKMSFVVTVWYRLPWFLSYSLQLYLLYTAVVIIVNRYHHGIEQCNNTRLGLAIVMCILSVGSILACLASFQYRFIYGSAPEMSTLDPTNSQRSISDTAISMEPMICPECGYGNDNISYENEMEEIILPEGHLTPTTGDFPYRYSTAEEETLAISNGGNGCATKTDYVTLNETNDVTQNNTNDATPHTTLQTYRRLSA